MPMAKPAEAEVSFGLIESLRSYSAMRDVCHCDQVFQVSAFAFYASCPQCGVQLKVRSFSGVTEIEDIFDTVFTWMNQAENAEIAKRRMEEIAADPDDA